MSSSVQQVDQQQPTTGFGSRLFDNLEEILSIALVGSLCVIVSLQVFFRLVVGHPLAWSEELATILFVWITMIGSSLALKKGEHFAVEMVHRKLSAADRRLAGILVGCLLILFSALLLYEGGGLAIRNINVVTPAMEISRAIPYGALPAGGALMLIRSIQILLHHWRFRADDSQEVAA